MVPIHATMTRAQGHSSRVRRSQAHASSRSPVAPPTPPRQDAGVDCPPDSRCNDCTFRVARLCIAVPRPNAAELLRAGQRVVSCLAYQGPQGELTAIEGTQHRVKLRIG